MGRQLSLEDILNCEDTQREVINVPEWGGEITIQGMTGEAKDSYEQSLFSKDEDGNYVRNLENIRAKLIAASVIRSDGKRMFDTESHVKALGNKSAKALDRVFEACQKINAITEKDIEDLEGN